MDDDIVNDIDDDIEDDIEDDIDDDIDNDIDDNIDDNIDDDIDDNDRETDNKTRRDSFRKMGPLGKLYNIVVHTRSSAGHTKEFKGLARRMIPQGNRTRWNSWYHMLQVALELNSAVDSYTKKYFSTLEIEYLSPIDWERLRTISVFLKLFNRATLETQGDESTIDNVLFNMDIIIKHLDNALVS